MLLFSARGLLILTPLPVVCILSPGSRGDNVFVSQLNSSAVPSASADPRHPFSWLFVIRSAPADRPARPGPTWSALLPGSPLGLVRRGSISGLIVVMPGSISGLMAYMRLCLWPYGSVSGLIVIMSGPISGFMTVCGSISGLMVMRGSISGLIVMRGSISGRSSLALSLAYVRSWTRMGG